jgi:hypothetical protein
MTGWKTKVGAVLIALGGILAAAGPVLPAELLVYAEWFHFVEVIMMAAGASFGVVGIAHKVEKAGTCETCGK